MASSTVRNRLALAILPTVSVLVVLALVQKFSRQKLLFASLASSAFLIYLDPHHVTNSTRTLILSQLSGAVIGFAANKALGDGCLAGGTAMVGVILAMILLDAMHPPAVSTALGFAFKAGPDSNLVLFTLALLLVVLLVGLQRVSVWLLRRLDLATSTG